MGSPWTVDGAGTITRSTTGDGSFYIALPPGTHAVSESTVPPGYVLDSSSCTSGTPSSFTLAIGGLSAVTCTFVNVPGVPGVELVKSADTSGGVGVGDVVVYEFVVTNTGDVTLSSLVVSDPLVGLSPVLCPGSVLVASGSMTCTASYVIGQADVDAGLIVNTATVEGVPPSGPNVSDTASETVILPQNPGVELVKSADTSGGVGVGDVVVYEFVVTNTGDVTLSSLVVSDPLVGLSPVLCPGSVLVASGSMTCTASYVIGQADVDAGLIVNTATVEGVPPSGPNVSDTASETVILPQNPGVELVKSADTSGGVGVGDVVVYEFVVTNTGDVTLSSLVVSDPLVGLSPVLCPGSVLVASGSMTCTASYVIGQADVDAGLIVNTATVEGVPPSGPNVSDTASETVILPQNPGVELVKSADTSGGVGVGDVVVYEFVVTNTGDVTLSSLVVSDPLVGLSPVSCPGSVLVASGSMTCTASYVIGQADVDAGLIVNTATVEGVPPSGPNVSDTASETVILPQNPDLSLDKELQENADEDGSGSVTRGDTLTYRFTAENTGNVVLSSVEIVDTRPGVSALVCDQPMPASLEPGEGITCAATYVVGPADVSAGEIANTGVATSEDVTGANPSDSDTEIVAVELAEPVSDIAVVKTVRSAGGAAVVWEIVVSNHGPDDANGPITLVDIVPDELIIDSAAGLGWVCDIESQTVTCTYQQPLMSGSSASILVETTAVAETNSGSVVTNSVSVSPAEGADDPNLANNSAEASATVGNLPFTGARLVMAAWSVLCIIVGTFLVWFGRRRHPNPISTP